jgi:hypothetical protein
MKIKRSLKKGTHVKVLGMWILLAVALAFCVPGVVLAQVFDTNLIVNGNAESGPASMDGDTPPYLNAPGWTLTGNFLVIPYDFDVDWPSSTDPGSPTRGSNLFIGGYGRADSSAAQSIDVSEGAAAIDASSVNYSLSGWLGGYGSEGDNAKLTITFRNADGAAIGTASIGPVTMGDRFSFTSMLFRQTEGPVPVGTRTIDVLLLMTYTTGVYNDGDADDLSLILSNSGSEPNFLLPVPAGPNAWSYAPTVAAVSLPDPADCRPFAVGDLTTGTLSLHIGLPGFSGGVDVYVGFQSNDALSPGVIYVVDETGSIVELSNGMPAWRTNVNSTAINEALFGNIPLADLPPGLYNLYLLVVPTGETDLSNYYFWATYFLNQ